MPAGGEQDLEHLLRTHTAEIAGSERVRPVVDRERAEQTYNGSLPTIVARARAHKLSYGEVPSAIPVDH